MNNLSQLSLYIQLGSTTLIWVWIGAKEAITYFVLLQITLFIINLLLKEYIKKGKDE